MIHQNAADHGWWEGKRSMEEIVALIHSEWSEALEEARAGRPMVYYNCMEGDAVINPCDPKDETDCAYYGKPDCPYRCKKPEGIAVELIDGCIRILDFFGECGIELGDPENGNPAAFEDLWGKNGADEDDVPDNAAELIALLHAHTSNIIIDDEHDPLNLVQAMSMALIWVNRQGIDPLKLLLEKHEYNKSRPYKHGKQF
jgi:hypothetical protein